MSTVNQKKIKRYLKRLEALKAQLNTDKTFVVRTATEDVQKFAGLDGMAVSLLVPHVLCTHEYTRFLITFLSDGVLTVYRLKHGWLYEKACPCPDPSSATFPQDLHKALAPHLNVAFRVNEGHEVVVAAHGDAPETEAERVIYAHAVCGGEVRWHAVSPTACALSCKECNLRALFSNEYVTLEQVSGRFSYRYR